MDDWPNELMAGWLNGWMDGGVNETWTEGNVMKGKKEWRDGLRNGRMDKRRD